MTDDTRKSNTIDVSWSRTTTIDEASINRFIDIVARRLIYWGCLIMISWVLAKMVVGWLLP